MPKYFISILFISILFCRCTDSSLIHARAKALMLIRKQMDSTNVYISDWNELGFRSISGLPKYCSHCQIDLSDSSLSIFHQGKTIQFSCKSMGLNMPTPISYSCFYPLSPGVSSSGGGDCVNQWDTVFNFTCASSSIADSLSAFLNILRTSKKIQ
jgi:hypothetical protein